MKTSILSLNVGHPQRMEWQGRTIQSSMDKRPVAGPLNVGELTIDGDSFASPEFHGTPDSVLYALSMPSAIAYMTRLGLPAAYTAGTVGENLTLAEFDEEQISVGDVFRIGEVEAQATFPRIPCTKLCFRMHHAEGQRAMQECGRSGVYFRILKTGRIHNGDTVERIRQADVTFTISEAYKIHLGGSRNWPADAVARARANGAFPKRIAERWA